jgi:tRNA uridine 5-carboxymethylaminomethyl modification enzyme
VLVDDLVTRGTSEPYRMFTSRAEYRLLLREDNADLRLTRVARELGAVDAARWEFFERKHERIDAESARLKKRVVHPGTLTSEQAATLQLQRETHAYSLLRRPEMSYRTLSELSEVGCADWMQLGDADERLVEQVQQQVDVQAKYTGYIERQQQEIERQRHHEGLPLPRELDYGQVQGLSTEVRQALRAVRPETLGQAARVPGVTPAAVSLLLVHLKRHGLSVRTQLAG